MSVVFVEQERELFDKTVMVWADGFFERVTDKGYRVVLPVFLKSNKGGLA